MNVIRKYKLIMMDFVIQRQFVVKLELVLKDHDVIRSGVWESPTTQDVLAGRYGLALENRQHFESALSNILQLDDLPKVITIAGDSPNDLVRAVESNRALDFINGQAYLVVDSANRIRAYFRVPLIEACHFLRGQRRSGKIVGFFRDSYKSHTNDWLREGF